MGTRSHVSVKSAGCLRRLQRSPAGPITPSHRACPATNRLADPGGPHGLYRRRSAWMDV